MNILKKHLKTATGIKPYWGIKDIPDLTNKVFLITGATNHYGRLLTQSLYAHNGSVIMVDHDKAAAYSVIHHLKAQTQSTGTLQFRQLDLNDTNEIQRFASDLKNEIVQLDVLINNASIKNVSKRQVNADGIEKHFQINFFGHFMLTNLLLPLLQMAQDPRIINVSAPLPSFANLKLNDLQLAQNYSNQRAFLQSKLAVQMATFYLQDISDHQMLGIKAMTAHAGVHDGKRQKYAKAGGFVKAVTNPWIGSDQTGALPILFAATDPNAQGGKLYAPSGLFHSQGRPQITRPIAIAQDKGLQNHLWTAASELAGFTSWASMAGA